MAPILYMSTTNQSPFSKTVLLTAEGLGLKLKMKLLDYAKREHLTPEFLKINPQHTVPTLNDDGYIIWDSHAIAAYLVDKYGKDDSLYPKDLQTRGTVNQRLFFESGFLFPLLFKIFRPILRGESTVLAAASVKEVKDAYALLNTFLKGRQFLAADQLTIADFSILTSFITANVFIPVDSEEFPELAAWFERLKKLPYYSITEEGLSRAKELAPSVTLSPE